MRKYVILTAAVLVAFAIFGWPPFTGAANSDVATASTFKTGIKRHPNGIYEVRVLTQMPDVKAEMVAWWFTDYMQTTEHYKRWHPTAHVWMDWENKTPGELIGASHLVHEYIGDELLKLRIQFVPHREILGDVELDEGTVAICARAGLLEEPVNATRMCHLVRNTEGGAEMRSVFWMGHVAKRDGNEEVGSAEGVLGNTYLARRLLVSDKGARDLMEHCVQEMQILAEFLPGLYESEKLGRSAPSS